jgi:hypothetical protein
MKLVGMNVENNRQHCLQSVTLTTISLKYRSYKQAENRPAPQRVSMTATVRIGNPNRYTAVF